MFHPLSSHSGGKLPRTLLLWGSWSVVPGHEQKVRSAPASLAQNAVKWPQAAQAALFSLPLAAFHLWQGVKGICPGIIICHSSIFFFPHHFPFFLEMGPFLIHIFKMVSQEMGKKLPQALSISPEIAFERVGQFLRSLTAGHKSQIQQALSH